MKLTGYITDIDGRSFTLTGINYNDWKLDKQYWASNIRRRVSNDKRECVVRIVKTTVCKKNNENCNIAKLNGCFVSVNASVKKYKFFAPPSTIPIEGWTLSANTVNNIKI